MRGGFGVFYYRFNEQNTLIAQRFDGAVQQQTGRRYNLTASISARNLFNHVNPGPIIGNINSPRFGQSNQIAGGYGAFAGNASNRRIELQLRLAF